MTRYEVWVNNDWRQVLAITLDTMRTYAAIITDDGTVETFCIEGRAIRTTPLLGTQER